MDIFENLSNEYKRDILKRECKYYNTEHGLSNLALKPTIVETIEYTFLKDDREKIKNIFMKNPIFNKYKNFKKYINIIDVFVDNDEFNTDSADNILITNSGYAILLKNINDERQYKGTSLNLNVDNIITECAHVEYYNTLLKKTTLIIIMFGSCCYARYLLLHKNN
jgi:hypothetical protein